MAEQPYDSVWPGEEELEAEWKATGGLDFEGKMWLTPRMLRCSAKLVEAWAEQDAKTRLAIDQA